MILLNKTKQSGDYLHVTWFIFQKATLLFDSRLRQDAGKATLNLLLLTHFGTETV